MVVEVLSFRSADEATAQRLDVNYTFDNNRKSHDTDHPSSLLYVIWL
jgi:hypothetical protein